MDELALYSHCFEDVRFSFSANLAQQLELFTDLTLLGAVGDEFEIPAVLRRNGLSFRFDHKHCFFLLLIVLIFLFLLGLAFLPSDLLALSAAVLDKDFFHNCLECIDSLEVEVFQILNAIDCRTCASCPEHYIPIVSISNHKMKYIVELTSIIGIADDLYF